MGKFKSLIRRWFTWLVQEQRRVVGRFQCGDLGVEEKIFSGKEWVCWCHVGGCHWLSNMTSVLGPTSCGGLRNPYVAQYQPCEVQ